MRNDSSDTKCNGRAVSSETVCDSSCRTVVVNLVSACFLIAAMATPACAPASGSPPAVATNESSSLAGKWNDAYLVAADGLFRFPGTLWFVAIGVVVVAWEAVSSLFAEGSTQPNGAGATIGSEFVFSANVVPNGGTFEHVMLCPYAFGYPYLVKIKTHTETWF